MGSLIEATPESWMDALLVGGFIKRRTGETRDVIETYQYALREWPTCRPGQEWIAQNAMVSVRTVKNVLRMLKAAGLIRVVPSKPTQAVDGQWSRKTNRYYVTIRGCSKQAFKSKDLLAMKKRRHRERCAAAKKRYLTEGQITAPITPLRVINRTAETVEVSRPVDISLSQEEMAASAAVLEAVKQQLRLRNRPRGK